MPIEWEKCVEEYRKRGVSEEEAYRRCAKLKEGWREEQEITDLEVQQELLQQELAVLKKRSQLPDSAFLLIKKEGGKVVKRSLPVTDDQGKIDCNHIRNALARANQVQGFSKAEIQQAIAKARKLLEKHCRKQEELGLQQFQVTLTKAEGDIDEEFTKILAKMEVKPNE